MKQKTKEQLISEIEILKSNITKLENNKEYSQIITENMSDNFAITTFDLKAKYLFVSPSIKQLLGYEPEEVIGRSFFEFVHPEDKKIILTILKNYLTETVKKVLGIDDPGISENLKFRIINKAGNWRLMNCNVKVVGKYLVSVVRDITNINQENEQLVQRGNFLDALNKATAVLLNDNKIPYQEYIEIIGKASNASRAYLFINHQNEKEKLITNQVVEYCNTGIKSEIDNPELQNLNFNKWIPRWQKTLSEGGVINGKVSNFPLNEREILEPQGIKAILVFPILVDNQFWGFIGFDNCDTDRDWTITEMDFLKAATKNLEQEISRHKSRQILKYDSFRFQTTMDAIDAVVYVSDLQTYELLFTNNLFNKVIGSDLGNKCYSVIQSGQTKPCEFCTNHLLLDKEGNPKEPYVWEFQNTKTKRWYQCRDQAIHWTDGRLVRLEVATDITDRKQIETDLKESGEHYRLLFDLLPYGGEVLDLNGIITNCSPSTSRMLGYELDELIGKHLTNFVDKKTKNIFRINFPKLRNGEPLTFEACLVHKNGTKIDVLRAVQPIFDDNGKVTSILALSVDIGERKKAEEALLLQTQELLDRNNELDAFSHTVAHDLKNPLSNIFGFASLLTQDYSLLSKDEILDYLNKIIISSNKTHQIINSLLLFANVRKAEVKTEDLDMDKIVSDSIKRLFRVVDKTDAIITKPEIWPNTIGNFQWVEEVWVNYLVNAIKYGGKPPVIEIGFDIEESETRLIDMVRFWVRDNGQGISKEDQKLLFKKFERLDQAALQGHGLGLSIVHRIIEKLGGEVGLESELGKGSIFYFTLPHSILSNQQSSQTIIGKEELSGKTSNLKILIAEDEKTADELLTILVENMSKETFHARTGTEAIKLYRQNPDIDLILMDIKMPGMDGYEATREIRKLNKNVVIIAQTAYALVGDREKSLDAGCDDYISKPINQKELLRIISKHLKR